MKLAYLANIRLPTEKAHGSQIMNMCAAFAGASIDTTLVVPRRRNFINADPFDYYGLPRSFTIRAIPVTDFLALPFLKRLGFLLESASFLTSLRWNLRREMFGAYYTRDLAAAAFVARTPLFYEIHSLPARATWVHRRAWRRAKGIVVISEGLRKALIAHSVPAEKILLARDAVDIKKFQIPESRAECRAKLNLPTDRKIVVYTGHLYSWKGADTLAQAAELLEGTGERARGGVKVYLVGGMHDDVAAFRARYHAPNLHIVGWQEPRLIPYWLKAADVLVIPNSAKEPIGAQYTSPLKLFEYMASGTPIVASRVPAIQEIISEGEVAFFAPDNPADLTAAIGRVLDGTSAPHVRPERLAEFTWTARAEHILRFMAQ